MLQLITFKEWKEWKETLDKGGGYDGLFIDLSFDSLLDGLQLAKLERYVLSCDYLPLPGLDHLGVPRTG